MEKQQFDFVRNDKFYSLSIPRYSNYNDVVLYEAHLKDLVNNKIYIQFFRFKELKQIHESLTDLKLELPEFPKTHFWRKTNKNPEMIQQRRIKLQYYFQIVINDPFTRGYPDIKKFVRQFKKRNLQRNFRLSNPPVKSMMTRTTRSRSEQKSSDVNVDIQILKSKKQIKNLIKS